MSSLQYDDHVAAVTDAVEAFGVALADGPLDARVPTCPDWDVAALAHHVGGFTGFWTHVICDGLGTQRTPYEEPPLSAGEDAVATWWSQTGAALIAALRAASADTAVWTWSPSHQNAAFVARRCAHELAVHRLDAQFARATPEPIDAALAADGIEEIFVMIEAWRSTESHARGIFEGTGETLHLHGTDPGRNDEWLLTLSADGLGVDRTHAKGDLAIRGAVADLELVLYDRPPLGAVETFGDSAVLRTWKSRFFSFG